MLVYITRPTASSVYMGGKRHLLLWVERPWYDHRPRFDGELWVDTGWQGPFSQGAYARDLLKQDEALLDAVMTQVVLSLRPKGTTPEEGLKWAESLDNWRSLMDEPDWEGRCHLCHKRFLLQVNLRTNQVGLVTPHVIDGDLEPTYEQATRRHHAPLDGLPF